MTFIDRMALAFADESSKIKQASVGASLKKALGDPSVARVGVPMAAGGLLTLGALRAKQDYQLGRQIRLSQGNQG